MKLQIEWNRPVPLKDARRQGLIYGTDLDKLPDAPGVYVFGRRYGTGIEALYVGKAKHIRRRVKAHLINNLRLMLRIRDAKSGNRIILAGRFIAKRGQQEDKCLRLIERSLIRHFLSEGHNLFNLQGTQLRQHEIASTGKHPKKLIPNPMYLQRAGRE